MQGQGRHLGYGVSAGYHGAICINGTRAVPAAPFMAGAMCSVVAAAADYVRRSAGVTEPIIVVGTGRCGMSTVAGMLVELGVHMGAGFTSDESNPQGSFEDALIRDVNRERSEGGSVVCWRNALQYIVDERRGSDGPWGWKDPRTADFMSDVLSMCPDATYIRCTRDYDGTLRSFYRWHRRSVEQVVAMIDGRTHNLDRYLPPSTITVSIAELRIDCDGVRERLRKVVEGA